MNHTSAVLAFCILGVVASLGSLIPANTQTTGRTTETHTVSPIVDELADKAGLKFRHFNGMTGKLFLPEVMGAGAALFDFDNDGDLDVFLVQGSALEASDQSARTPLPWRELGEPRGRLFHNDLAVSKDGSRSLHFTDVTDKSGIVANRYGMGVAVGDINNDGWPDLYITNLGSNQMYLNKVDGTFVDITKKSETDDPRGSTSEHASDLD